MDTETKRKGTGGHGNRQGRYKLGKELAKKIQGDKKTERDDTGGKGNNRQRYTGEHETERMIQAVKETDSDDTGILDTRIHMD